MPIELLSWDEVKKDLLFIKPIVEYFEIQIDENALKEVFYDRTIDYLMTRTDAQYGCYADFELIGESIIKDINNSFLTEKMPWSEDIISAFRKEEFVQKFIVPELRKKGFGKDVELINKLAKIPNKKAPENIQFGVDYVPVFFDEELAKKNVYDSVAVALLSKNVVSTDTYVNLILTLNEDELKELIKIRSEMRNEKIKQGPFDDGHQQDIELGELELLRDVLELLRAEEAMLAEQEEKLQEGKTIIE